MAELEPINDVEQTVTRTEAAGVDTTGAAVHQQTKRVQTHAATDTKATVQNIVWFILGFIEILLALRFVLKLLGANSASGFVNLIYSVTNILTAPFDTIFGVTRATAGQTQSVFEPSILVAAAVYALVAWGIVKLITINRKG